METPAVGILALSISAGTIAFLHTFAPDHWMPFAALARAQGWSRFKLLWVTFTAGLGHVGASVVVGLLGLWLGWALDAIQWMQGERGTLSLYLLMAFGAAYALWGHVRARDWREAHGHGDAVHTHAHGHDTHHHPHPERSPVDPTRISAWTMFVVLVLGPCEALVPLMFAGVRLGVAGVLWATFAFSAVTLLTMVGLAMLAHEGFGFVKQKHFFERHAHTLTGAAISSTAAAVLLLGI